MKVHTNLIYLLALACLASQSLAILSHSHKNRKFLSQTQAKDASDFIVYNGHSYDNRTSSPAADFIFGVLLIVMSFPVLWNNERKQVKFYNLLTKGDRECVDADFR